jgi:hypothetical protein
MKTQTLSQSILKYFMMLIFILFMNAVFAQPENLEDPDGPVDGGLTFLLIAGAAYGARKLHQYKNKTTE